MNLINCIKCLSFLLLFNNFNFNKTSFYYEDNYLNDERLEKVDYESCLLNKFSSYDDFVEVEFKCNSNFDISNDDNIKFDISKDNDKYTLKVYANINKGEHFLGVNSDVDKILDLFLYSDGAYTSASLVSFNDAKANYYKKYVDNFNDINLCNTSETISNYYDNMSQYNNFVFGNDDFAYIECIKNFNDGKIKISGKCTIEENNEIFPLRGNRVVLRSYAFINVGYGVTFTDEDGYYSFELDYNNYVANEKPIFYVSIQGETKSNCIYNESGYNYLINSDLLENIDNGSEVYSEFNIICNKSDRAASYLINQILDVPYLYVNELENRFLDQVNVIFPRTDNTSAAYSHANKSIKIPKIKYNLPDVITHEYGHYIEDEFSLSYLVGDAHAIDDNLIDKYGKDKGMKLCYTEALATYLGIASQLYFKDRFEGLYSYGDYCYTFYGGSYVNFDLYKNQYTGCSIVHGEGSETSVTSSLLKFLDDKNRENDYVKLGDLKMWEAINKQKHAYFYLLIDDLINLNSSYKDNINIILEKEGFSTSITSDLKVLETTLNENLYEVTWNIDDKNLFNGNVFNIHFFGSNGEYIISNINSNSYSLNDEDINYIFSLDYNFVEYYLESLNSNEFNSGFYASQISRLYFQASNIINFGESSSYNLTSSSYMWFKFVAPYTSVFYFESISDIDLYGELFNYICMDDYSYNVLQQNDDGGTNLNFKLSIQLKVNNIIFLRVRGINSNVNGNFSIKITSDHTSHNYVYSYKQYSSKQHKSYCECGEFIYSSHSYTSDSFSGTVSKYCEYCNYYNSKGPVIVKPSL